MTTVIHQTLFGDDVIVLFGGGTDPDHHFLAFQWTNDSGQTVATVPHMCTNGNSPGTYNFTLTVDDGHGGSAADAVTYLLQ